MIFEDDAILMQLFDIYQEDEESLTNSVVRYAKENTNQPIHIEKVPEKGGTQDFNVSFKLDKIQESNDDSNNEPKKKKKQSTE